MQFSLTKIFTETWINKNPFETRQILSIRLALFSTTIHWELGIKRMHGGFVCIRRLSAACRLFFLSPSHFSQLKSISVKHYARKCAASFCLTERKMLEFTRYAKNSAYTSRKNGSIENKLQKNETEHKLQFLTFFFFLFLFQFQIYFRHLFNYETRVQLQ